MHHVAGFIYLFHTVLTLIKLSVITNKSNKLQNTNGNTVTDPTTYPKQCIPPILPWIIIINYYYFKIVKRTNFFLYIFSSYFSTVIKKKSSITIVFRDDID